VLLGLHIDEFDEISEQAVITRSCSGRCDRLASTELFPQVLNLSALRCNVLEPDLCCLVRSTQLLLQLLDLILEGVDFFGFAVVSVVLGSALAARLVTFGVCTTTAMAPKTDGSVRFAPQHIRWLGHV